MIELQLKIKKELKEKGAILLAHYYQRKEIQEIADFLGDSLALSKKAQSTNAKIIVFAGVKFMAESAKILNPNSKVLLPSLDAACSLADSCDSKKFEDFKLSNPEHLVVSYINTSAEIKALSDICCTSSNALRIINSFDKDQKIIFAPDKNLGAYLNRVSGRKMLLWDGACHVHDEFSFSKINSIKEKHPGSKLISHPESSEVILRISDFIGSTSELLKFINEDDSQKYIVATEVGIINQMEIVQPEKIFIPAPINMNNSCACSECEYMKTITLENLYQCIKEEKNEIKLEPELMKKAMVPIERMMKK